MYLFRKLLKTEFNKTKFELSVQIEAFIYCKYNKYWYYLHI